MKKPKEQHINKIHVLPSNSGMTNHKIAFLTTLFTAGGIYISFLVLLLIKDSNALNILYDAQASIGGLYVNLFAIICVAYSKFAKEKLVHNKVYWLSLASFVIIVSIFAQAKCMVESSVKPIFDWFASPYVSWALQLFLIVIIYIIALQEELNLRITYTKKKLN